MRLLNILLGLSRRDDFQYLVDRSLPPVPSPPPFDPRHDPKPRTKRPRTHPGADAVAALALVNSEAYERCVLWRYGIRARPDAQRPLLCERPSLPLPRAPLVPHLRRRLDACRSEGRLGVSAALHPADCAGSGKAPEGDRGPRSSAAGLRRVDVCCGGAGDSFVVVECYERRSEGVREGGIEGEGEAGRVEGTRRK